MNKNRELTMGIPQEAIAGILTISLLKRAEIPVARYQINQPEQIVWFDGFTQAVRKPTDTQQVNSLRVITMREGEIRGLVAAGALDLGVTTTTENAGQALAGTSIELKLPGTDRFTTIAAELLLKEPIDPELLTKDLLRKVNNFRDRLALSIVRASRGVANDAAQATVRLEEDKQKPNYWEFAEGRAYWN